MYEFCGFYDFEKSTTDEFATFRGQTLARLPFLFAGGLCGFLILFGP